MLRPVAEHGVRVVITKQPLGIAFLNTFAFASTAAAYPDVATWDVGGHSLGGTVACIDADNHDTDRLYTVLKHDDDLWQELSEAGRAVVARHFSPAVVHDQVQAVFGPYLNRRPRRVGNGPG